MDFKLLYIFGFFFISVKSRSLFPNLESSSVSENGNAGSPGGNESSGDTTESAWDKFMKMGNQHLQPAADKFSELKDKFPKEWKNPFAKKKDEDNLDLGSLFGEEGSSNPGENESSGDPKESALDKFKKLGAHLQPAADKFSELKDKFPKEWKNPFAKEKDEDDLGLGNLYGEEESALDKFKKLGAHLKPAADKISELKDKFPKEWKNPFAKGNKDEDDLGLGNLYGDEESPNSGGNESGGDPKESALDKFKKLGAHLQPAADKFSELKNKFPKEWKNPFAKGKDEDDLGLGNLYDEESPNSGGNESSGDPKESALDKFKKLGAHLQPAADKFSELKDKFPKEWKNPFAQGSKDEDDLGLGNLYDEEGGGDENSKMKALLNKLNPKETFDKTKDAVTDSNWWPFKNKNHNGGSPTSDVDYDNDESPDVDKSEPYHGDPVINGLDEEPENTEEHKKHNPHESPSENPHHWPLNGWENLLHPKTSDDPHEDASEKKPHHAPETLGELLEEELEELEEEAEKEVEHPKHPSYEWPNFSWDDDIHEEPKSHKPHSKEHEHENGDKHHHKHSPDESEHHPKDEDHTGSPEKGSKEHGKEDASNQDSMFPKWFTKSEENPSPNSHNNESEEEYGNPDESQNSPSSHHEKQHGGKEYPKGTLVPHLPSWFTSEKEPEPEEHKHKKHHGHHHHHQPQLLEEPFYDVRGIGDDWKTEQAQGKSDDEEEDEDDDDGSDDGDGNGSETDGNDTDDDNEIGHEKENDDDIDPDEAKIMKELEEENEKKSKNKSKPKRNSDDEADDDSSDSDDDDDDGYDDDDDENREALDNAEKNFSIWDIVLPVVKKNLPSIPNPFSLLNRVTVSFGSINDLQRDPEYLHKSLIKKVNQKYQKNYEKTLPGTTISVWPPTITTG